MKPVKTSSWLVSSIFSKANGNIYKFENISLYYTHNFNVLTRHYMLDKKKESNCYYCSVR